MTNDMIAVASNWEERLRPPKCDKKATGLGYICPHLLALTERDNNKTEGTDNLQNTCHNWEKNYKLQHLALNKTKSMSKVCQGFATTVHFVVAMENTTNQWYHVFTNDD